MKHYFVAEYHVLSFGWGTSDEREGLMTVLAETSLEARELARVELEKEHPRSVVTVKIAETVGY